MSSPTLDTHTNTTFSGASSATLSVSTTLTNDVLLIVVAHESTSAPTKTVSNVTASGLTFVRRAQGLYDPSHMGLEVWWAPVASTISSLTVTVTLSGSIDDAWIGAYAVNGVHDITAPWDSNVSLPAFTAGTGGLPSPVFSTSQADDLIFCSGMSNTSAIPGTATGTTIDTPINAGGTLFCTGRNTYRQVSTVQNSVSGDVTNNGAGAYILYADAMTADVIVTSPLIQSSEVNPTVSPYRNAGVGSHGTNLSLMANSAIPATLMGQACL